MLALSLIGCAASNVAAQETATQSEASSNSQISIEQIEHALADLEQSTDVAVDVKLQATENYRAAIKNLQSAADLDARLKSLISETETVAERAKHLKAQSAELKSKKPAIESGLEIQALEQLLPTTELQLSGYKKARQDGESELQLRAPRRKEIRARLMLIQEKIADASSQLAALASSEPTPQTQSLTSRLLTRKVALEREKPTLEAELSKFDAEEAANLVRLRIEVAVSNGAFTEKVIALLQQKVNAAREAAAEESVRAARREAINADPALRIYAEQNQGLAENAKGLAEALAENDGKLKTSTETYDRLIRQFEQTKKKVDSLGLSSSVGALLRKQMMTFPNVASRRAAVAERQKVINDTQYQLFEYEEAHQELAEMDDAVDKILANVNKQQSVNVALLESAAHDLMKRKQEYLDGLVRNTGQYFDTLIELDAVDQQIIALVAEYKNYIDERVLWIRSGPPLTVGIHVEESDAWLLSPRKWHEAWGVVIQDAKRYAFLYILCAAVVGPLLVRGRSLRRAITTVGEIAEKASCHSIAPTFRGLWLTCVLSLRWPILCIFVGWRLGKGAETSEFSAAIGQALTVVGLLWSSIEFVRQLCRRKGIGEAHFRWPVDATTKFRRGVKFCAIVALPIFFVSSTLASSDGIHERSDLQRIVFMLGMIVLGCGVFRLFRPAGIFREYFGRNESRFVGKFKLLFPIGGVACCASLVVLSAAGYFFTAQTLFWRLFATCLFVATLFVARSILYRMLLLRRRQLSIQQARERAAAAKIAAEGSASSELVCTVPTDIHQADISTHSLQSQNLVTAAMSAAAIIGLWMIWIQVLPALSMIGNHPIWGNSEVATTDSASATLPIMAGPGQSATGQSASTPGQTAVATTEEQLSNPITVSDLALAILIVVVTVVLFRNGPGLLEMSVLQQLPMDASVRYAITTLISYVIVMVGTIAACSTIGLQWSQIQWLATALTFGLAFGLQEMFANFVAGLIILLERPVRVGDVVTVDEVSGVVSRIRIRATSITNWDRKEYVVPNKEFITGKLLNWTLSDKVNRIVVEVGVAYGSNTEQACELLLKAANDHPVVLTDPAAIAGFEGFGDSSLKLTLRAFLPSLDNRLQIIHELHTAIDQLFRQANIEISYPQRDLHLRTTVAALENVPVERDSTVVPNDEIRDAA